MFDLAALREQWKDVAPLVVVEDLPNSIDHVDAVDENGDWVRTTSFLEFCGDDDETIERARLLASAPTVILALIAEVEAVRARRCENCASYRPLSDYQGHCSREVMQEASLGDGGVFDGGYVAPDFGCVQWRPKE